MIYFTADLHIGHENIVKYCQRPFKNAGKMNTILKNVFNDIVKEDDTTYFLGDLALFSETQKAALEQVIRNLNGKKKLVLGNHDIMNPFTYQEIGFAGVHTYLDRYFKWEDNVYRVHLSHDPCVAQVPNSIWICGHVHNIFKVSYSKKLNNVIVNVGVDMWDFKPVSLKEVFELAYMTVQSSKGNWEIIQKNSQLEVEE